MFFEALGIVPIYTDVTLAAEIETVPDFVTKKWKGTGGALACAMSHRTACRALLDSNEQFAVVFEDDNEIPDLSTVTRYHMIVAELKKRVNDFNLINLSPCHSLLPLKRSQLQIKTVPNAHLYKATGCCTNAYIVSRAGAEYILQMDWNTPWDDYLRKIPRAFDVHRRLFKQNSKPSSIGNKASSPEYKLIQPFTIAAAACALISILVIIICYIKRRQPSTFVYKST